MDDTLDIYGGDHFTGILFDGRSGIENFFKVKCPCGVEDTFPLNGIPEVDTPQSCGKPNHWAFRYINQPKTVNQRGDESQAQQM